MYLYLVFISFRMYMYTYVKEDKPTPVKITLFSCKAALQICFTHVFFVENCFILIIQKDRFHFDINLYLGIYLLNHDLKKKCIYINFICICSVKEILNQIKFQELCA